ncbi:Rid family hydrolase [uncultured Pseudokineococcus sp.]|uniref:Rid family hydrolase n=1 Tax=uncultured Pseudokineococcus sp. TaxID=1642928 RepID=UPI00262834D2|nr:Rid family hydrolase [uncultured Pseudokineococcus sp.]
MLRVAGATAATAASPPIGGDEPEEQAREALRRIAAALEQVGAGPEHAMSTRLYVTDISR